MGVEDFRIPDRSRASSDENAPVIRLDHEFGSERTGNHTRLRVEFSRHAATCGTHYNSCSEFSESINRGATICQT